MKTKLLFFFMGISIAALCQRPKIEVTHEGYCDYDEYQRWHRINAVYTGKISECFWYSAGLGYNSTLLFRKEPTENYNPLPRSEKRIENFNLLIGCNFHVIEPRKSFELYLFEKMHFGRTSFYRIASYDSLGYSYSRDEYSPSGFFFDNALGAGINLRLFGRVGMTARFGGVYFYADERQFDKHGFGWYKEIGLFCHL
jgi:hypothetical protein